jgi:hypothetical protein
MTTTKWMLTSSFTTILLLGCGGGDSGDDTGTANSGGSSNNPINTQLTLNTVVTNKCNVQSPKPGVEVLFHNAQGDVIAEHVTDSNGLLTTEWPSDAKHVTTVALNYFTRNYGFRTLSIDTIMDTKGGDLGVIHFTDNRYTLDCDCKDVTFFVQNLIESSPESKLNIGGGQEYLTPYTQDFSLEWCDAKGPIDIQLVAADHQSSQAGQIDLTNLDEYTLSLDDFNHVGVMVNDPVNSRDDDIHAYSSGGWDSYNYANEPIFIYPTIAEHHYVSSSITKQIKVYDTVGYSANSAIRKLDKQGNVSSEIVLDVNNAFSKEAYSLYETIRSQQAPYQYDFSNTSDDIAFTEIALGGRNGDGNVSWRLHGGIRGTIPNFSFTPSLDATIHMISSQSIRVVVKRYGDKKTLDEWRTLFVEQSRMADPELSPLTTESNLMGLGFYDIEYTY